MKTAGLIVTTLLAAALAAPSGARAASTTDYSDQWWVAEESGWGISVLQQSDILFVDLFVYGPGGAPTWLTAAARYRSDSAAGHAVFDGDLFATAGSYFAAPWSPGALAYRKAGTLSFDATSVDAATLTYSVDGVPVVKKVSRQTFRLDSFAGSYFGGWAADRAGCTASADNGSFESGGTIDITHGADGAVTIHFVAADGSEDVRYAGAYSQAGHLGRIVAATSSPPGQGTIEMFELERKAAGFTGRFRGSIQTGNGTCQLANGRIAGVRR